MIGVEPAAESVGDYVVGHHPRVPRLGEATQARLATDRLEHRPHRPIMPRSCRRGKVDGW